MDADRLARVEAIFQELLDLPAAERGARMIRLCAGDRELQSFVQRLLDHDADGLGSFMKPPPSTGTPAQSESSEGSPPLPDSIGHYEILRKIGQGGSGTVYEAHDTRLRRSVALKVLPATVARDPDSLLRFQREARAVAALNHTNIVTLHSVEESEGTHFLTMELVEGQSLSDVIGSTPMPPARILELAIPIVEAIAYAHDRGIVHRDLKPGNLMIAEDGQPKVLDFSIAKILGTTELRSSTGSADDESLTAAGGILGTYGYTSPEQLLGSGIDARSDIFSLGVVLYEMATGRRPFAAESRSEIAAAILNKTPVSAAEIEPSIPLRLDETIARCLKKDREERFATAGELRGALAAIHAGISSSANTSAHSRWRPIAVAALLLPVLFVVFSTLRNQGTDPVGVRKRLAVLPFENLGATEDAYFAAGVTEEITSRLAEIGGLSVASRTSAVRSANSNKSLAEIGTELGVAYILEGGVRIEELANGTRHVLVTPQLIEVSSDAHLWTNRYSSKIAPGEMFSVQASIAERVAAALGVALPEGERRAIRNEPTANAEAYEDFLLGRFHWNKRNPGGLELAASYFEDAVARDPNFARAYAGLADAYVLFPLYGVRAFERREAYDRAESAARRALDLDESLAEAHTSLAVARFYGSWDFESAEPLFQSAIRLDPEYAVARYWYGELLAATGRIEEAIEQAEQAVANDPLLALGHHLLGVWLVAAGHEREGEERLLRAAELEPNFPYVHSELGDLYFRTGRYDEAITEWERFGIPREVAGLVVDASKEPSLHEQASQAIEDLESSPFFPGPLGNLGMASLYALVGEPSTALDRLDQAYEERSEELIYLPTMTLTDPGIKLLTDQPRFTKLLESVGLD